MIEVDVPFLTLRRNSTLDWKFSSPLMLPESAKLRVLESYPKNSKSSPLDRIARMGAHSPELELP